MRNILINLIVSGQDPLFSMQSIVIMSVIYILGYLWREMSRQLGLGRESVYYAIHYKYHVHYFNVKY